MIIPSPYELNGEEWINPFATIIEGGTPPDFVDSCYMQMDHYDGKFKDLEPCISGGSSILIMQQGSMSHR